MQRTIVQPPVAGAPALAELKHWLGISRPNDDDALTALLDASLTWSSDDDRVSIGLHGKNLFDKRYITSGYQFLSVAPNGTPLRTAGGALIPSLGREGVVTAFYGNPRQVFLTAGYKF